MKYMLSFQCDTHEEAQAILAAVAAIGKEPMACSRQYVPKEELQAQLNTAAREAIDKIPVARKNVSPGEPSITKIGMNTEGALFGVLRAGGQPEAKLAEHMKLLWKRGKVKFDGEEYYL